MRYCANCRFFQPNSHMSADSKLRFGRCGHPFAAEPPSHERFLSPMFDQPGENKFASLMREHGPCGEDAKFYEPREPEAVAA